MNSVCVVLEHGQKVTVYTDDCEIQRLNTHSQAGIRNISGSTPYQASGGWLEMWKKMYKYRGDENPECALHGCGRQSGVGGHMQYNRESNGWVYIIPICQWHNSTKRDGELHSLKHDGVAGRAIVQR